jgi:hypothetical protein
MFKYLSKYHGNICPANGRSEVILVRYKLPLDFLTYKHFRRWGFHKIGVATLVVFPVHMVAFYTRLVGNFST